MSEEGHIKHFKKFLKVEQKPVKPKRFQPYEDNKTVGQVRINQSKHNSNDSKASNDADSSDLHMLNEVEKGELIEITYLTTGCKSEFRCGNTIIRFKTACARKGKLTDDTRAARSVRKMWQIGKKDLTNKMINEIMSGFTKQDGMFLRRIRNWLPAWLGDKFDNPIYIDSPQYKYNYQQFYAVDPKTGWLVSEEVGDYCTAKCTNSINKLKGCKQIRAA